MATNMIEVTLIESELGANESSTAVAAGKRVIEAMRDGAGDACIPVMISDNDLSESVWAEMEAYLARRGVSLRYDHDLCFPVAEVQS